MRGGAYSLLGPISDFGVNGSAGTMLLRAAGTTRTALLPDVSARDVDVRFRTQTDKLVTGTNGVYADFVARRVSNSLEYRGKLQFRPDGELYLHATRVVNGVETTLTPQAGFPLAVRVPGLLYQHRPNARFWVRGQVVGANPTTIRLKAWADGQAEPAAWQYSATDSTADLQTAGAVGLRAYLAAGSTNAPVKVSFEDFLMQAP